MPTTIVYVRREKGFEGIALKGRPHEHRFWPSLEKGPFLALTQREMILSRHAPKSSCKIGSEKTLS